MTIREQAFLGHPLDCLMIDMHTHLGGYYVRGWFQPPELDNPEKFVALAQRLGTDYIVTAPHLMIYGDMEMANKLAAESAERFPGVVYCYLSVCPDQGLCILKEQLQKYAGRSDFVGLKLLGGYHGSYTRREYQYALDFADEKACPVLCHTWENDPSIGEFKNILQKRSRLSLIAAHLGGGNEGMTIQFASLMREYPNLYMDICGQIENTLSMEETVDLVGDDRLLYGTDMINVNPCYDFGRLAFSCLSDETKRKIFAENFLTLQEKSSMGRIAVSKRYQMGGNKVEKGYTTIFRL